MNLGFRLFFILLFLYVPSTMFSQGQPSGRVEKFHSKALMYYNASAYDEALEEVQKALKINDRYIESWLLAGDIYALKGNNQEAIRSYSKAISIDHNFFPPAVYILANLQFEEKQYAACISNYEGYLQYPEARQAEKNKCLKNLGTASFRLDAMANPQPVKPVNLGIAVNTAGYEFVNYISPDVEHLYFTRRMTSGDTRDENFFFSARENDTTWRPAVELGAPVNSPGDEGALCISPDGQYLFYSACNRPDGYGSCDIYVSKREGDRWGKPENLGPGVNSSFWETQPSFAPDGKTLYFVSNRSGGIGSSDIWLSRLDDSGNWSEPENPGTSINTQESERGPFIHPDGKTLYFSSKGHTGMGEGDIFFASLDEEGRWSKPANIGYPLNTEADEVTFVVDNAGKYAYYSSAAEGGSGLQDIYRVIVPEKIRPLPVTYMKGIVTDSLTGRFLSASFKLTDIGSGKPVAHSVSDPVNGEFLICIPSGKKYALAVEKPGYLFYSAHFALEGEAGIREPYLQNIRLKPIREGETIVMRNIFFETDSSRLLPESETELNSLHDLLNQNPGLRIEISGHTDNTGGESYNQLLSEKRAGSVYRYLTGKGIAFQRLSYKGFGATKPVADNSSPEGRAINRRTEFKVLGVK
ncbi:MAG: PD40 domain-containing protein [Bacteroidales bacterium]|nr:PD40 domain-containing protein [Bacteroidales bacterium]